MGVGGRVNALKFCLTHCCARPAEGRSNLMQSICCSADYVDFQPVILLQLLKPVFVKQFNAVFGDETKANDSPENCFGNFINDSR